jgi:sucrose phosphorylase
VHVLPFAPWSSDGGFSVIDYEAVDDRYGTWDDIESLGRSRPVMFDAVINHLSAESPWFQQFLADDPAHRGFFRTSDPAVDHHSVVRPRTHPLLTPFTKVDGETIHVWTTFSPDQVDLDYAEPAVLLRILDVLLGYCRRGAAAIRLDAIGFLWKDEATSSIHLPQTHQLTQLMRSCIDDVAPGTILISETNVPHAENISYLGGDATGGFTPEVQAVYQFPLAPLTAHAAITGDTAVLETWAAGIDQHVGPGRSFLNFLACHDGIGVRPVEGLLDTDQLGVLIAACRVAGGRVNERTLADGSTAPYELNTTWFELLAADTTEAVAIQRHLASHAVMLALPGIAAIYAQSFFGADNDHAAVEESGHARDINRARFADRAALVAAIEGDTRARAIFDGLASLVAMRRRSAAFHPEAASKVVASPDGVFAIERGSGADRALVIVNLGSSAADISATLDGAWRGLGDGEHPTHTLGPYESLWLEPAT